MKFLHSIVDGKDNLIRMDEIKTIEEIKCIPSKYKVIVAKTKDYEYISLVGERENMEPRVYISELFKIVSRAPDYSIIRTCEENGDWCLEVE